MQRMSKYFTVIVIGLVGLVWILDRNSREQTQETELQENTEKMKSPVVVEEKKRYWVISERLNRHTCPSKNCGVVGQYFFREGAEIFESKAEWGRVSKYYSASCSNGISEYVDSGNAKCEPENGIVDGKFAEWVVMKSLSEQRPRDPALDAKASERLVAKSDDFRKYRKVFVEAADALIRNRQCKEKDFIEWGGWIKSTNHRIEPIYFMYCGDPNRPNRIYLNAETGEIFR